MKQHVKIIILIVFVCNICAAHLKKETKKKPTKETLPKKMENLFKEYYSCSFLLQGLAHYMNKSELALPGFSHLFHDFSIMDRRHANRVLELTALYQFRLTSYTINTRHLVNKAIRRYELVTKDCHLKKKKCEDQKKARKNFPYCSRISFGNNTVDFNFLTGKDNRKTTLPSVSQILKFLQVVDYCYHLLNMKHFLEPPHLKYTLLREFSTEQIQRRKYIRDLIEKLGTKENRIVEFFLDKTLRSTTY